MRPTSFSAIIRLDFPPQESNDLLQWRARGGAFLMNPAGQCARAGLR